MNHVNAQTMMPGVQVFMFVYLLLLQIVWKEKGVSLSLNEEERHCVRANYKAACDNLTSLMITPLTSWVMAAVCLVLHALTFSPHQLCIDSGSLDMFQGRVQLIDWGEQSKCSVGSPGHISCDGRPSPVKHFVSNISLVI